MIDRTELLRMIMENNPGQPAAYILEQYAVYLKGLAEISGVGVVTSPMPEVADLLTQSESIASPKSERENLTRGYTKRNLKVKPDDAILDDKILCCVCGKECQTLTERHLATHNGLTREGYIKL